MKVLCILAQTKVKEALNNNNTSLGLAFRNWNPVSGVWLQTLNLLWNCSAPPFSLSDPSSTTGRHLFYSWTLYSTVLYLGHCVSFFLEYIMLENTPLSYFLKWIATEAELCCKTRQSRTFCNAPASITTSRWGRVSDGMVMMMMSRSWSRKAKKSK